MMLPLLIAAAQTSNSWFNLVRDGSALTSIKRPNDAFDTDYLAPKASLGKATLRWRSAGETAWGSGDGVTTQSTFETKGEALEWTVQVRNTTGKPVEIGDLAIPLPFNTQYGNSRDDTYTKRLVRHAFVGGDGSFIFWMRTNGVGPFLTMVPERGTSLEYFDAAERTFRVFIHSAAAQEELKAKGGKWRMAPTALPLAPGATQRYAFRFRWSDGYEGVRKTLIQEGGIDVNVAPGMTVPTDLDTRLVLRTQQKITTLNPQFPAETAVQKDGKGYRVRFSHLGENTLTVEYGAGQRMALDFFVTEPIETLIKKRAAFLVSHEQHRNPDKWYDGLYSQWDMKNQILRSPEDKDTLQGYAVASDDPILGRAPYIATKNVYYPDQGEIDSLELYLRKFVWGGLQQTTEEPFPYAVYGINDWKTLRNSPKDDRTGKKHIWRIYDYPHMIALYLSMSRVARDHPKMVHYLDADGYLRRAWGTAMAFFEVPLKVEGWSAYDTGTYNEVVIPDLIRTLEARGMKTEADGLRAHWEKKAATFINDKPNLYGSEYAFDSTGFESTEALAHYTMDRLGQPAASSFRTAVKPDAAKEFLELQIRLNLACRGWLEPAYYWMGSDYRASGGTNYTLSYMAQMGGWGVTDYGLNFANDPAPYLRLGSASYLSSWALMNTGTAASNYGYWYPGKANDGGAGGGFEPRPWGRAWLGNKEMGRGSWWYSGEIDLGFTGALRAAATIVTGDPVFGPIAYGGNLEKQGKSWSVVPRDGLRARFHVLRGKRRFDIEFPRDGFAADRPIVFDDDLKTVTFEVENRSREEHVILPTLSDGYEILVDGQPVRQIPVRTGKVTKVVLKHR